MKRIFLLFLFLPFVAGCFETSFNFKTAVKRDGRVERHVQIDGRGANRFVPPSGPEWEVKTFETKGGQSILDDTHYHIHAEGHFKNPNNIESDFRFDVAKLFENLTEETRSEFAAEIGIPEPFEREIYGQNRIEFERKRNFLTTEYYYKESFRYRWLIPILLHDLKKEIRRQHAASSAPAAVGGTLEPAAEFETEPAEPLSEEEVETLAQEKLVNDILSKLQFHAEVTLPGALKHSNATQIVSNTAVWDFKGTDFADHYSVYVIEATSQAPNVGLIVAGAVLLLAVIWAFAFTRQERSRSPRRARDKK